MRRVAYGRTVPYQVTRLKWLKVEAKSRDSSSPASKGEKKNQDKESIEFFFSKVVHAEWGEDLRRRKFQDESTSWGGRLRVAVLSLSLIVMLRDSEGETVKKRKTRATSLNDVRLGWRGKKSHGATTTASFIHHTLAHTRMWRAWRWGNNAAASAATWTEN